MWQIYWVGPILGAIIGTAFFKFVLHFKWQVNGCGWRHPLFQRLIETSMAVPQAADKLSVDGICISKWFYFDAVKTSPRIAPFHVLHTSSSRNRSLNVLELLTQMMIFKKGFAFIKYALKQNIHILFFPPMIHITNISWSITCSSLNRISQSVLFHNHLNF